MIKAIEFPNKSFATKEDLFYELKKNESKLIDLKKSQVYKSHEKGQFSFLNLSKVLDSIKGIDGAKDNFIYPIISTTNYMDSHKDVHFNGSMTKTAKEQNGKVVYALDHELKFDSIIAWQKDVSMSIKLIDWSLVGKSYAGQTEALVFEINKDNITRKDVLAAIENKVSEFQNSIRMVYHKLKLGINSTSKDYTENKAYYDSRINEIANKEVAEEDGYFWGIEELGIYKEGSLVVAGGSNDATSIYNKAQDMSEDFSDIKWLKSMIDHHEMALEMANEAIKNSSNSDVIKLAENIIEAQSLEIDYIKKLIKKIKSKKSIKSNEPLLGTQYMEPSVDTQIKQTINYNYLLTNLKNK